MTEKKKTSKRDIASSIKKERTQSMWDPKVGFVDYENTVGK